jgi:hypothetical protein
MVGHVLRRAILSLVIPCSAALAQGAPVASGGQAEAAYRASMKSDLRNLVVAEEAYYADHATYAGALSALNYNTSYGVRVFLGVVNASGYSALARHEGTTTTCGIYVGTAPPPISGQAEGEPRCDGETQPAASGAEAAGPVATEEGALAVMKSDLRNLVTSQESYFAGHRAYASKVGDLDFEVSRGVTITLVAASSTGWSATASHIATRKTCGIFVGDATPPQAGLQEGQPRCN